MWARVDSLLVYIEKIQAWEIGTITKSRLDSLNNNEVELKMLMTEATALGNSAQNVVPACREEVRTKELKKGQGLS